MKAKKIKKELNKVGIDYEKFLEDSLPYIFEQSEMVDEFIRKFLALSDKYGRDRNLDVWCMAEALKDFDFSDLEIE